MRLLGSCYYLVVTSVIDGLQINPSTKKTGGDGVEGQINSLKIGQLNFPKNINKSFDVQLVLSKKLSAPGINPGVDIIKYLP